MKINKIKYSVLFSALMGVFLLTGVANAQSYNDPYYYGNSYQYQGLSPYGVSYYDNSYYYNNYPYNYGYDNNNYNYSYNNYSYDTSYYYNNYNYPYNYNYHNNGYYGNYYGYVISPTTYAATNAFTSSATINGYVSLSNSGNGSYGSNGTAWFQFGTNPNNLSRTTRPANIYTSTTINSNLTGLSCGTTYYFRAVTSGQNGVKYGSTLSFTTSSCYNNYYSNYYPNYNYSNYGHNQSFDTHCGYNNSYWR